MTRTPLIAAVGVHKAFAGSVALSGVSLELFAGEVHCLAGENGCGKSTVIKVLAGVHRPDSGHIIVDQRPYPFLTPRLSMDLGINVIYQDFALLPNLSVAENVALPIAATSRRRLFSAAAAQETALEALDALGVSIDPRATVEDLGIAQRQLVAIARALAQRARVIFLDEPTTALTWREVDALLGVIDRLRSTGIGMVFVSHKLQEVLQVSDRISVMRNGEVVASGATAEFDRRRLVEAMTGRDLGLESTQHHGNRAVPDDKSKGLQVRNLTLTGAFSNVSFDVPGGAIVGMAGLLGSGRTEIADALFGLERATSGQVSVAGKPVKLQSPVDAVKAGIAYVPEDRLTQGLFLNQSTADNLIVGGVDKHAVFGALKRRSIRTQVLRSVSELRIKAGDVGAPVRTLSGGNAQRVVIARWLLREPSVLILNGPTVGVDVGSKFDILALLRSMSLQGLAVLLISDDLDELVAVCSQVHVVRRGQIVATLANDQLTTDSLSDAMAAA